MTDALVTRLATETLTNLTTTPALRLTRFATETLVSLDGVASINVTRFATEMLTSYFKVFINVPHTEVWSGFPVVVNELTGQITAQILKDTVIKLRNGTAPYSTTADWVVYNGGALSITAGGRLVTNTGGSWYQQQVQLSAEQRKFINNRDIKILATFNLSASAADTDSAAFYVSFLNYDKAWIGGKGFNFVDAPDLEAGTDYEIEEWVPIGTHYIVFEVLANRVTGTENSNYLGSVSAVLSSQTNRKHVVLKANKSTDDSGTAMTLTSGTEMPETKTFGVFNYYGRYGGSTAATSGYYDIPAPIETLKSIYHGTARVSLGAYQFNENAGDESSVSLEFLNSSEVVLDSLSTGALTNFGITGTVSDLENTSIPPATTKFRLKMDYNRIDGTTLDAVISNLVSIIDYDTLAPDIPSSLVVEPVSIESEEEFGTPTVGELAESIIYPSSIESEEEFGVASISQQLSAELTVLASSISSDLTDFLLLINLADMGAAFWANVASDGSDCYITNTSDTMLNYFLVDFDSINETGYVYVKSNLSSTVDNVFKVKYGGGQSDQQDTATALSNYAAYFVAKVDGNLYELVTGTSWTDGNTTSVVSENMTMHPQTGYPLVSGNRIEGSTTPVVLADAISALTDFTIAATLTPPFIAGVHMSIITYMNQYSTSPQRYGLNVRGDSPEGSPYPIGTWNPSDSWLISSYNPVGNEYTRTHLTTESGVQRIIYTQGAQSAIDTTINATAAGLDTVVLGVEDASRAEVFSGNIAHAYVRSGALTADFIAAEYANMQSPATFYTIT